MDDKIKMDENGYKYMNQRPPGPPNVLQQPYQGGSPMYTQGYAPMYGGPPQPRFLPPTGAPLPPGVVWTPISSQPPPEYVQSPVMMQRPTIMNPICHQMPEGGIPIDPANYPPGQYYPQGKPPGVNKQYPSMDYNSNMYKPVATEINKPAMFHPNAPPPHVASSTPAEVNKNVPAQQQERVVETKPTKKAQPVSIGKSPKTYEPEDETEELESDNNNEDDDVVEKEAKDDPSFEPSGSEEEEEGNESDFSSPTSDEESNSDSDEIMMSRKRRKVSVGGTQSRVTRSQSTDSRSSKTARDQSYHPTGRTKNSPVRKRSSTRLTTTRRVNNPITDSDEDSDLSLPSDDDTDYDEMDLCQGQPVVKRRKVVQRRPSVKRPGRKPKKKAPSKAVSGVYFAHSSELERLEAVLTDDDDIDFDNFFIWKLNNELLQKYVFVKGSRNFEMTSNFIGFFKNDLTNYVEINVQAVYGENKLVALSDQLVKKDQAVIKRLSGVETGTPMPKRRGRKPSANKPVKPPPQPKGLRPRGRPKKKVEEPLDPEKMEVIPVDDNPQVNEKVKTEETKSVQDNSSPVIDDTKLTEPPKMDNSPTAKDNCNPDNDSKNNIESNAQIADNFSEKLPDSENLKSEVVESLNPAQKTEVKGLVSKDDIPIMDEKSVIKNNSEFAEKQILNANLNPDECLKSEKNAGETEPAVQENLNVKSPLKTDAKETTKHPEKRDNGDIIKETDPEPTKANFKSYLKKIIGHEMSAEQTEDDCTAVENTIASLTNNLKNQIDFTPDIFNDLNTLPVLRFNAIENNEQKDKKIMILSGKKYDLVTLQSLNAEEKTKKYEILAELQKIATLYHTFQHHKFKMFEKWRLINLDDNNNNGANSDKNPDKADSIELDVSAIVNEIVSNVCGSIAKENTKDFDSWCDEVFDNFTELQQQVIQFLK